jgi:hypothetical protein
MKSIYNLFQNLKTFGKNIIIEPVEIRQESFKYYLVGAIIGKDTLGTITKVRDKSNDMIREYSLYQNYPNPFNPNTTIKFKINQTAYIRLNIYDLTGKEITTLLSEEKRSGEYGIVWNGKNSSDKNVFGVIREHITKHISS